MNDRTPETCQGASKALGGSVVKAPAVEGGWHTTGAKSTLAVHNQSTQEPPNGVHNGGGMDVTFRSAAGAGEQAILAR